MTRRLRRFASLSVALLFAACTERDIGGLPSVEAAISDGVHEGGTPGFYFLPPMVAQPTFSGTFDTDITTLDPAIAICDVTSGPDSNCGGTGGTPAVIVFTTTSTPAITVDLTTPQYHVNWDTKGVGFIEGHTYRAHVKTNLGACRSELGFADVLLTTTAGQVKPLSTGDIVVLQDGRTLPIHFRIETGIPPKLVVGGLVSWWPGEGNANDVVDGNDGTLQGGVTFAPGKVGQAFLLNGIDGYIDAGNAPNLHVSTGDFTVESWVRFSALSHPPGGNTGGAPQGDMSIVDKMSASDNQNLDGWRLLKQNDNHFWFCLGGGNDGGNRCVDPNTGASYGQYTVRSTTAASTGTWYHVVGVNTATSFAIYVNGSLEDGRSRDPFFRPFLDTQTASLLIGSNASQGAHLNGEIDEVTLYNRALNGSEIQSLYVAGSAGKCAP